MKAFLEEYGLIIVVVAVIMVMLLLGTTVGADAKDNIIATVANFLTVAEQVEPELENPGSPTAEPTAVLVEDNGGVCSPSNINCSAYFKLSNPSGLELTVVEGYSKAGIVSADGLTIDTVRSTFSKDSYNTTTITDKTKDVILMESSANTIANGGATFVLYVEYKLGDETKEMMIVKHGFVTPILTTTGSLSGNAVLYEVKTSNYESFDNLTLKIYRKVTSNAGEVTVESVKSGWTLYDTYNSDKRTLIFQKSAYTSSTFAMVTILSYNDNGVTKEIVSNVRYY